MKASHGICYSVMGGCKACVALCWSCMWGQGLVTLVTLGLAHSTCLSGAQCFLFMDTISYTLSKGFGDQTKNIPVVWMYTHSLCCLVLICCLNLTNITRLQAKSDKICIFEIWSMQGRNKVRLHTILFPVDWITTMVYSQGFKKREALKQVQRIQNTAARVLTKTWKYNHVTPVRKSLHWLPDTQRTDFKLLLLVYKWLFCSGPKSSSWICLCHMNLLEPLGHLELVILLSQELQQNTVKQHFLTMQHRPGLTSQLILANPRLWPLLSRCKTMAYFTFPTQPSNV